MKTTIQIFKEEDNPEKIEVHHKITEKEYEIAIKRGGSFLRISLDNLKSILKVAKRNLKEGERK